MKLAALTLIGSAAAFAPAQTGKATTAIKAFEGDEKPRATGVSLNRPSVSVLAVQVPAGIDVVPHRKGEAACTTDRPRAQGPHVLNKRT